MFLRFRVNARQLPGNGVAMVFSVGDTFQFAISNICWLGQVAKASCPFAAVADAVAAALASAVASLLLLLMLPEWKYDAANVNITDYMCRCA